MFVLCGWLVCFPTLTSDAPPHLRTYSRTLTYSRTHPQRARAPRYAGAEEDIFDFLELGQRNRKTASTDMNDTSSRSHSIFMLELTQKRMDGTTRVSRLNLVDLAGSESVKKTHATGQTFNEAKKINLSLSALGNCIKALTAKGGGRSHIPYRDSKLTRVLQESLGGNSKTTLLVCLSPHHDNFEETLSTLRFAQRAKQIVTRARVNERQSPEMMQKTIEALRRDLRTVQVARACPCAVHTYKRVFVRAW